MSQLSKAIAYHRAQHGYDGNNPYRDRQHERRDRVFSLPHRHSRDKREPPSGECQTSPLTASRW